MIKMIVFLVAFQVVPLQKTRKYKSAKKKTNEAEENISSMALSVIEAVMKKTTTMNTSKPTAKNRVKCKDTFLQRQSLTDLMALVQQHQNYKKYGGMWAINFREIEHYCK